MIKTINNVLNKNNFEVHTKYFDNNINKNSLIIISSSTLKFLMKIKIKNLTNISSISTASLNLDNIDFSQSNIFDADIFVFLSKKKEHI